MRRDVRWSGGLSVLVLISIVALGLRAASHAEGDASQKPALAGSGEQAKPVPTEQVKAKEGSRFGVVEAGPIKETTVVRGTVDAKLDGVWLLVSNVEVAPGKFRNFVQLFKITKGDNGPEFHLLDVKLPDDVDAAIKNAKVDRWQPSAEMRKSLAAQVKQLPPFKEKTINDFLYESVKYEVTAPDRYSELGQGEPKLQKALDDTKFSVRITESYKPRELPPDVPIGQLAQRVSIYGVKQADTDVLQGEQLTGFIAVSVGAPVPFSFTGPFTMYRLASL